MRFILAGFLLVVSSMAMADELADANAALLKKSYPQALALYTKLASAGNAEAQLRLGEMYWYGEGVALDRAKGDALFAQAAASGNKAAVEAQGLSARRAARMGDIEHWTTSYDGADLTRGKFSCPAPVIPDVSKKNDEIKKTTAAFNAWQDCQRAFSANIDDALPVGKRIPGDVLELMSEEEVNQAKRRLSEVYAAVMDKAAAEATAIIARRDHWEKATVAYVTEENKLTEARNLKARIDFEMNAQTRMLSNSDMGNSRVVAPSK